MSFSEERASGQFGPINLLVAENPYVLWDALEHWTTVWQSSSECSRIRLDGRRIDLDQLAATTTALPMFEDRQLVVIEHVDKVPVARRDEFLQILKRQSDATKILMTAAMLDKRLKYTKELMKLVPVEVFPRIYENHLPGWAHRIATDFGTTLSNQSAGILASVHGNDLFEMRQTIERAVLFVGTPARRIEEADINTVAAGVGDQTIFMLTDSIGRGELPRSLTILESLMSGGDQFGLLIASLFNHFQRLVRLTTVPSGQSDAEAARMLGMHPYIVGRLRTQAARLGPEALSGALGISFEMDMVVKSSYMPQRLAMQIFVFRLCCHSRLTEPPWFDLEATRMWE